MKSHTHRSRIAWLLFCLIMSSGSVMLGRLTPALAQTPVKSSREARLRRIEEHRQIRQRTMELSRDLRKLHLTPEQKSEIRQVLARYNTSPNRHAANTGGPAAERMTSEVLQVLTSDQSNKLKQEREERAQRGPDFDVRKKP
jgi:hypothetical protein